ncbi:MAG TPA: hypothetical protein VNF05_02805 [Acidimicrobiales bacterium]|nr:hypothetical protein [Acidimicrobiales bacterium]
MRENRRAGVLVRTQEIEPPRTPEVEKTRGPERGRNPSSSSWTSFSSVTVLTPARAKLAPDGGGGRDVFRHGLHDGNLVETAESPRGRNGRERPRTDARPTA